MFRTHAQLENDIARWQASGWVTPEGGDAIRSELAGRRSIVGLTQGLAILAAALVSAAVLSFVAANWQEMSKLARLAVVFAGLWSAFAGAAWLEARKLPYFANAALLAAVGIFGAGIMLIAQMYHMDGHPPDAVLLWGIGALLTGWLLLAPVPLRAALVIFLLWSVMEMSTGGNASGARVHWPFLPAFAAVAGGFAVTRSAKGLEILAATLALWAAINIYRVNDIEGVACHLWVLGLGLLTMSASTATPRLRPELRGIADWFLPGGFVTAMLGTFGLQFVSRWGNAHTLLLGVLVLIAIVGALWWAWQTDRHTLLRPAYAAFGLEIFSIYVQKIGTLLGTSAFFLIAGLLVAGLAWAAVKLHAKASPTKGGTP